MFQKAISLNQLTKYIGFPKLRQLCILIEVSFNEDNGITAVRFYLFFLLKQE